MRVLALICLCLAPGCVDAAESKPRPPVWKVLAPFESLEEFNDYRQRVWEAARANRLIWGSQPRDGSLPLLAQAEPGVPCDPAIQECDDENLAESLQSVVVTGLRGSLKATVQASRSAVTAVSAADVGSITNNQEAGVDEGDIVKAWGRFFIVLMHGRLFSVDTADSARGLKLVDRIDSYRDAREESWIDEMLITGDKIIVTGYSYRTDSTNYSVFRIGRDGRFTFLAQYSVDSEDYYSSENYASRIVGGKLVVYMPFSLADYRNRAHVPLPRIRRWTEQGGYGEWQPMFDITDVYRPIQPTYWPAVHVLTFCDLEGDARKPCEAKGAVGPWRRETYVTPDHYYLWLTTDENEYDQTGDRADCVPGHDTFHQRGHPSAVFRLDLKRHRLSAVHAEGWPSDQFALEERDGDLWALVQRPPARCRESESDERGVALALARVPADFFSARPQPLGMGDFFRVPRVQDPWNQQTRFSANHVMYGSAPGYWRRGDEHSARSRQLTVVPLNSPRRSWQLSLDHTVTRIELFGDHAVSFGHLPGDDFAVSSVSLERRPRIADTQVMPGLAESEGRSHAFNARVDEDGAGIFGLPTVDLGQQPSYWHERKVDVQFFTATGDLQLDSARHLSGKSDVQREITGYRCEVSCYDWYGNARPIFYRGRIFALVGLELIEGEMFDGRILETGRVDLSGNPAFPR